jgi:regulator of protease activity HflC (stomatin/prohibitin superfamily)
MFATVLLVVLLLAVIGLLIARRFAVRREADRKPNPYRSSEVYPSKIMAIAAGGLLSVFVVVAIFSCFATVSARSVGVGTAFGKFTQTYSPGITFKAPWESIEEFSTQIQTVEQKVPVSYAGGGGGDINTKVRYTVDAAKVQALWAKYKTFEKVQQDLVNASVLDSVSTVAGGYSPTEARDGKNRRPIAAKILSDLNSVVADDGIKLDSVSVTDVNLNAQSQASIDANVKAAADVEKAKTEQERATIDAATAKIREQQGALTGPALQRYCLEVTNSWDVKKNGSLPATWNCFAPVAADVLVSAK